MTLDDLKQELLSKLEGLDGWKINITTFSLTMSPVDEEIKDRASFHPERCIPISIYKLQDHDAKDWETSLSWKLNLRSSKYKTSKGLIRRMQLAVNTANTMMATDRAEWVKAQAEKALLLEKLKPYIEEYGDIFNVNSLNGVVMSFGHFKGKVNLETEHVNMTHTSYDTNMVPMHLAIPFMKEVELYNLLE